jgi:hypothetical protein
MPSVCDKQTGEEKKLCTIIEETKKELKDLIADTQCCVDKCQTSIKCATSKTNISALTSEIAELTSKMTQLRLSLVENSVNAVKRGEGGSGGKKRSKKSTSRRKRKTSKKSWFY